MSLPDVHDSLAYTGHPIRRPGYAKRTLSDDDLTDVVVRHKSTSDDTADPGGSVKRTKSIEKVRYSYIDPEWQYDPETLGERLSERNAKEAGIRDIDEGSKRNSLGRKRKSWMKDHENESTTEPPLEEVKEPDPGPVMFIEPSPVIELKSAPAEIHLESGPEAAMTGDENPSKEDLAASDDELEEVVEQHDIVYEAFVGAHGNDLQRLEESLEREKEGLLDELTGGISSSVRPQSRVVPSDGEQPHTDHSNDMSPVAGYPNSTEDHHREFYDPSKDFYDPNESFRDRPKHYGPGISPDAILASMIMERLGSQKPVRARVGRRVEDDEKSLTKEYVPTLPYRSLKHPPGLPPDGPPHYTPRGSGRGRGDPNAYLYGPYTRPGERPMPAPRSQPQAHQKPNPPPKSNAGPIIHGARPEGVFERPKTVEPEAEQEPGMIPDPVVGAVEAAIKKRDANKNVPEEYAGYYIETCVGVDEDFYNSPLAKRRMHPSKREYTLGELSLRAKYGLRSPEDETRAKSLERGLEDARREEYAYEQEMAEGASTLERGRERERVTRARKQLVTDEGSQGSLGGSKERVKPAIARKPKISEKLKQEFRTASQERGNTPTANDMLRQEFIERVGSTEKGVSMEKKDTMTGTVKITENSSSTTVTTGTVQKTVVRTNQSSGIEVVELSDTSSTSSSRPGSRPGSAGATRPQNLGKKNDFMYNAMLQQSIATAVSRHGASKSVPRDQASSMDRSMTRDPPTAANKMKRRQTSSMDRQSARRSFFEPDSEQTQEKEISLEHGKDEKTREKGAHDRASSHSRFGSDRNSPRTPGTAELRPKGSTSPGGPVLAGSAPAGSVKITGGPLISGLVPETAMQGSVERGDEKKKDDRVATALIITKTPEPGKGRKGTVERGQDVTKSGGVITPPISVKAPELHTAKDGTQDKHFKKKSETSVAYKERVQKSESTPSFRETTLDASDSFRTPNRGFEYDHEMDISTISNDVRSGASKTTRSKSSDHIKDGETQKSNSKDRRKKDLKNRKEIRPDESFDSQYSVTLHTDNSDTTYGQDSMTQAAVRGAVRDTVHDNIFGKETTLSPVTPGTNWGKMEDRFSTPKGKKEKEKKSKGGFFSFGSKRKPRRSRENSLDSTLDTTMDSTFDKRSLASMGSQDTLNETVTRSGHRTEKGKERERSKDRTVKVKNRRVKGKEALKEVTNQETDSISDMYIEDDDDLLKKEEMARIGRVPMEMTSTPDGQRKAMKKPKSDRKVEIVDLQDGRSRDRSKPSDENREGEYTTTKDVMNAMFVGSMEGKKRSPRKKSKERAGRRDEEERLHVTELSIDEMLKEREISKDDRQRVKETNSSRAVKENSVDRRHNEKEHTSSKTRKDKSSSRTHKDPSSSRTHKDTSLTRTHKGGDDRHRSNSNRNEKEIDERQRTKMNTSRTQKDSDEERQIVKRHSSKSESDRYVKKKNKEPSDATRAIMSELLLQVGASPSRKHRDDTKEHDRGEDDEVVYRKVVKKRTGQSSERRRHVQRKEEGTGEFEDRNGEAAVKDGKRREGKNGHAQNGRDSSYEEYKVEWNEYPEDEFENTSYSGFDVSLDDVIQERENRKSEVFRMLLEDTAFEKKLRRLAEKRAREMDKAGDTGSEGTGSTPRSSDRSSEKSTESMDEMDLLRELEKRIEEYFERQKQKKIKALLKKFMAEEGTRMSRLMSHEDEVLDLIALKDREMYGEIIEPQLPPAPEAEPPEYSRSVLYVSADVFEELDTQVIEIAQHEQASYIELVRDLTRRCKTELDRVRAIFRWITVKDLNKIRFDADERINPESLLGMLKGIKEGKASYHDLFKRLCGYAGIHCTVIQGYSKGAGYRPGMRVEHKAFRNTWTAVNVNKSWRFVNCNWGARHYKNASPIKQDTTGKDLCYKCDEFYFLTDPEDHIFQHFPDDKKWQLLRHPITVMEFMKLPVLKSPFFNAGLMKPTRKLEDRIYTQDGRIEIAFKMRKFPGLHCTLELIEGKTVIPEPEGHSLIRIIDDDVIFLVTPPDIGRYFFNVYVAENWKSNSLEHAAAFLIIAGDDCFDNGSNGVFPTTGVIGKTPVMKKLGIDIPLEQDPYIMISCNTWTEVTLPFTLKRDVKLSHQMKLFNREGKYVGDYDQFVFLKYKGSKSYCVRCPREGVYALSVFAGDAKDRSPKLECIFKYLIDCESAQMSAPPFPKPSRRWIGCVLHEPISGELEVNTKYTFGLEIPDAIEVSVVIGDKWQALEFSEQSEDLWEGKVHTGSKPGVPATVFVRYDEDSDKFSPLLDYTVVSNKIAKQGKAFHTASSRAIEQLFKPTE